MTAAACFDVVVPTLGRPSLPALLEALGAQAGHLPGRVILVWDRGDPGAPELPAWPSSLAGRVAVVRGRGAGPAAARNAGWRAARAPWVAFLDDDVEPGPTWAADLAGDLAGLPPGVAGSQGVLRVPLPAGRRPTDWERNVHGLEGARWITADLAYRRSVLAELGGFDERFPRAYREDADLGLRVVRAGYGIVAGRRAATHPVRPAGWLVSVRLQAGNADDALMRALHGPGWRAAAGVPGGRRARHLAVSAAGLLALAALAAGRRRLALAGAAGWAAGTGELAWARVAPGPRTPAEVATMLATSVLIPPAASWHWLAGLAAGRRRLTVRPVAGRPAAVPPDRDRTLVRDVPYDGDPERVTPMPGARRAPARLRAAAVDLVLGAGARRR
jgi:Glycosyl transferase family 2